MMKSKIIAAGEYKKHPAWFNALNAMWGLGYTKGSAPFFQKDELLMAARRATGLSDFGKDFMDEPLDRLVDSLNREARLHPIGAFITRKRMINLLNVRLRAEYWFKKHPEILDQELAPPLVIVGMQRTGTTKLHRMLSADPQNRILRSWEALNPVPLHRDLNGRERRIKAAKTSEKALRKMAPGFFAIHPVEYSAPEEDILLLDVTFLSTTPEAITHVPSYASWLEQTDQSYAYEYGSKLLRFLQWQQPGKRWILKSPHHLEFLDLVRKYYGARQFVWTHRALHECIPSFLSMVCHSRALFSNEVPMEEVTRHWVEKTSYMLEKGLAFRQSGQHESLFTDILYEDLVGDALAELERIYASFGGISPELAGRFRALEKENPQGKYGIHAYDHHDFGLKKEELYERNGAYMDLFQGLKDSEKVEKNDRFKTGI